VRVYATYKMRKLQLNTCSPTIFIMPLSDNEVAKVIKDLKGKLSAGIDKVAD
jgi:hypothetical protein